MTSSTKSDQFKALFGVNAGYVEKTYDDYCSRPESVSEEWRRFFAASGLEVEAPETGRAAQEANTTERHEEPLPESKSKSKSKSKSRQEPESDLAEPLRGVAARIVRNMEDSLSIPTATSTRELPVKVLVENRRVINQHLATHFLGKVSFTHIIAWAMAQALRDMPSLCVSYLEKDGKPFRLRAESIHIGLAIDLPGKGGKRSLVVPNIKDCGDLSFAEFVKGYDDLIDKARRGKLEPDDFRDTTCTLTNPGMIGTVSSLPRLMQGQSLILAIGSIDVPAAYQGAAPSTLSELGISKVMTLTNTYDHRVIQGADSGEFLQRLHSLLIGEEEFYERIFRSLDIPHRPLLFTRDVRPAPGSPLRATDEQERAARVMQYIRAYRVRGYLLADLDPLGYEIQRFPELEMASYGLTIWDLDREFFSNGCTDKPIATLREIREALRTTYTADVGVEYMHIADPEQKHWLRERMEGNRNAEPLSEQTQIKVLDALVEAEAFERFLHTRFVGHKRFSLEGGETLVPALEGLLDRAAERGVERCVLGMAHRGRLNVLAHVMHKPLTRIFSEFEGVIDTDLAQGSGDVKYHLGTRGTADTWDHGQIELELASNPSHLEAVDPVVEGMARARQDRCDGDGRSQILPVLVHGDAAFAGQGVVAETINMSQLHGYRTGGTVHLIVNNQIGYTTLPEDARSSHFCSDIAKAIQAPIFHVNGDNPLAAVRMVRLAFDYRAHFHRDVVLDIVCYRRHGHNEGDEPSFTQPLLYEKIENHRTVREIYQDFLVRAGVLAVDDTARFDEAVQTKLRESLDQVRRTEPSEPELPTPAPAAEWPRLDVDGPDLAKLQELAGKMWNLPDHLNAHHKIGKIFERRLQMVDGKTPVDFATAEHLAFASLLVAGRTVRLAGQDSGRGTFSQRHSVVFDVTNEEGYIPLNFLEEDQARYHVIDSLLSEEAALGFEYGYSVVGEDVLTIWEAQFGDFVNGAQIQIDQFLASGEAKWNQRSGLVLLLPHGYDGQGPEHSSARLERFLQLCANGNLRVANPSNAANYYHLLRKQALDPDRKPLIVMTPKSLLRQRVAGSAIEELAEQSFRPVIGDDGLDDDRAREVERVVLCSGKVYYDLLEARGDHPVALVRVEQLYPWPESELQEVLERFPNHQEVVWCQEEPRNMGAYVHALQRTRIDGYAGRPAAASPATGFLAQHKAEQQALVEAALESPATREEVRRTREDATDPAPSS